MHVNYKKYNNIIYPNLICTFSRHSTIAFFAFLLGPKPKLFSENLLS